MASRWAQQQAALAKPGAPVEAKPTPAAPKATPDPVTRPRGRPKTRLSTLDEVAEYLYVSRSTIYRLIETRQLPHLRIGSVMRFDLPSVLRWAQNSTDSDDELMSDDDPAE